MKNKSSKSKNNSLHGNMERLKRLKRSREKSQEKQKNCLRPYPYYPYHKRENKTQTETKTETVDFSVQQNLNLTVAEVAEAVPKPDTLPNSALAPEPVSASVTAATSASTSVSALISASAKISKENPDKRFHRLEIWFADLGEPNDKFIEAGWHPVLIISNDTNNELSPIVTVAPISSKTNKLYLPGHVFIDTTDVDSTGVCGNIRGMRIVNYPFRPGSILLEQITVLDKRQLEKYAGKITSPERIKILNRAIGSFLGVN